MNKLIKPRYEYYHGTTDVIDNELDTFVEDVVDRLNEQDQKIKDLEEAKLADSKKQIEDTREAVNIAVDSWCKNRRKYEAQIAEMQNKSFILYSMLCEALEKQGCENVASQIDYMTGWVYDKEADWLKGNRNYDQLKQKLTEKDQQIADLQHRLEVAEKALDNLYEKFKIVAVEYAKMETIPSKLHFKEQAESEVRGE